MIIDNTRLVVHDRKMMYMLAILLAVVIFGIVLSEVFDKNYFGITREGYIIIVAGIYVLYNIFRFLQDLNYIYYSDNADKIIIKFYSLRPLAKKRQSFEIAKSSFLKFEIKKSLFGFKETVTLYQKIKNHVAKYPPLSISSLTKEEKKQLYASLRAYSIQKTS